MSLFSSSNTATNQGFSIIELMVTISIVVLVTGIALGRYSMFNSAVLLKAQAYEIALDIRQAQAYGVSASAQTGNQRSPFGVYFNQDNNSGGYILYQDTTFPFQRYSPNDEQVGVSYSLDPRFEIRRVCAGSSESNCNNTNGVSIQFKRPNFNAIIWRTESSVTDHQYTEIEIGIVGNSQLTQRVVVTATGLITVEAVE